MSGWDLAIYIVFVLWLGALVAIALVVRQMINGPIASTVKSGRSLTSTVLEVVASGKRVAAINKMPLVSLSAHVRNITTAVRLESGHAVFADEPVNYAKILSLLTTVRSIRGGLQTLNRFRNRKAIAATVTVAAPAKPSFAEKLGLIPPAARHVAPVIKYAKIALQTHRELRKRGIY